MTSATPALLDAIVEAYETHGSLHIIATLDGMPARRTICYWMSADTDFNRRMAEAKDAWLAAGHERLAALVAEPYPVDAAGRIDRGAIEARRLQADTQKWSLARSRPREYGDRVTVENTGSLEISTLTDEQLAQRIANASRDLSRLAGRASPEADPD